MAVDTTLTSYTYDPWAGEVSSGDIIEFSYADLGFTPSASDSYKSTSGDVFKVYIAGVRIYRTSDSAYAGGSGFLEDGDASGSPGTLAGISAGWADTSDDVWYIDTANQKVFVDQSEVTSSLLYGTGTTTSGAADGLEVAFTSGTTIIELRRSTQDQSGPSVDFSNASILTEQDLDNSGKNVFHMAQEAVVTAGKALLYNTGAGVYEAYQPGSSVKKRITQVAAPTASYDAVTKTYLEDTWLTSGDKTNSATVAGLSDEIALIGTSAMATATTGHIPVVAANNANVTAVGGKATEIGRLGTADAVEDMALLGTTDCVADMALLGTAECVADMAILGTADVVADLNTLATADIVNDLNTLATSDIVTDLNVLATSDIVNDINILATSDIVSDLNTLATSDIVTDLNTLATADIVTDINVLATSDIVADLNTLATSDIVTDINLLATSDIVADLNTLATSDIVSDLNTLGTSAIVSDLETVADNIVGVNAFAARYRVASSAPGSDNDDGDLYYNTTSNQLNVHDGSSWGAIGQTEAQTIVTADNSATAMAIALG